MRARAETRLDSVVILAGGRSERMGREKALLEVGGMTLIERLAQRFKPRLERLLVSVAHSGPSAGLRAALERCEASLGRPIEVVCDPMEGEGPLFGLAAALEALEDPQAFFVAVDMPNASPDLACELWRIALEHQALGVVPRWSRGLEPAFAVYCKCLLPQANRLLESGVRSLQALASIPGVRMLELVDDRAISRLLGPAGSAPDVLFQSLNTPDDLKAWMESRSSDGVI